MQFGVPPPSEDRDEVENTGERRRALQRLRAAQGIEGLDVPGKGRLVR